MTTATLLLAVALTGLGPTAVSSSGTYASEATRPKVRWLAAGDSYSSGEGIPRTGGTCAQAATAWARLAGATLEDAEVLEIGDERLVFEACTGATIDPTLNPTNSWDQQRSKAIATQKGPFDLITFTFGGNDLGFADRIYDCLGFKKLPSQPPAKAPDDIQLNFEVHHCSFTRDALLSDINRYQSKLETFYKGLLADSSLLATGGHIVVVGYPLIFEDPKNWPWYVQGSCWGIVRDDITMLNEGIVQMNAVIAKAALNTGLDRVHYVNVNSYASGFPKHALCRKGVGDDQDSGQWINGWTLGGDYEFSTLQPRFQQTFHPNQAGHEYYASVVVEAIKKLHFEQPPPVTDWRSTRYEVACPGIANVPFTADVHDGRAQVPPSEDREAFDVRVSEVKMGDLTGDNRAEVAVLLVCSPSSGGPNFYTTEVQIFDDRVELVARLSPPDRYGSDFSFYPRFTGEPYALQDGRLRTGTEYWHGDDAHCCPSIHEVITWQWDGGQFVPGPVERPHADDVAREFWDATFSADEETALSVGTQEVYDELRSYLSYEESAVDPTKFTFSGCGMERPGKFFCEYRADLGSTFVDQIYLTVFDDGNGHLSVGAMRRECGSPQYGSCP